MKLSIVITTKNRKAELFSCIEAIKKADYQNLDWELIVVDDASSDGTEQLDVQQLGIENGLMIHNQQCQMMVKSRNIGAKKAKGRYLLFVDDDNVVDRQMVRCLVEAAEKHSDYGIVGPAIYSQASRKRYWDYQRINFFTSKTTAFIDDSSRKYNFSDGIPNVFLIKKKVFDRTGYFDEDLLQTLTEPDFYFTARKFGYQCVVIKKAITYHRINLEQRFSPEELGGDFQQKAYCLMRNRTLIVKRYGQWYHKIIYLVFFSWLWPLVYSLLVLRRPRVDLVRLYWRGWWDGLVYFFIGKLKNSLD